MNFQEYSDGAEQYYERNKNVLRRGQAYYNYLQSRSPRIANLIEAYAMGGQNVDPFYEDSLIPNFLAIVHSELEGVQ